MVEPLDSVVVRPSTGLFSSHILLVRKADGSRWMCMDYWGLNQEMVKDKFSIPLIDELFDELHGLVVFSKLDLLFRYHQIRVALEDVLNRAFKTHESHYEFLVMPFRLTNAPSTFKRLMNDVFRPYFRRFGLVLFDDILIYNKCWSDHMGHLEKVLEILQKELASCKIIEM